MNSPETTERNIGLLGATGVGVGAIVGGGILALAGVAFATTGPAAIVAFALNGVIALLTALSFAEMASKFPQSGGTYTFAKKVLSVEAAFTVGWVVWFASIVAAVLYAVGFAHFLMVMVSGIPVWPGGQRSGVADRLAHRDRGGRGARRSCCPSASPGSPPAAVSGPTSGKVVVFAVLIVAGLWGLTREPTAEIGAHLQTLLLRRLRRPDPGHGLHLHRLAGLRPDRRGGR